MQISNGVDWSISYYKTPLEILIIIKIEESCLKISNGVKWNNE